VDLQDRSGGDFTIGVYPMQPDGTCWFVAADFDNASWPDDTRVFLETCKHFDVPAALERSRSGNGGHIWIFFAEPIPAAMARKMGAFLLTQTMERRPETPALAAQVQCRFGLLRSLFPQPRFAYASLRGLWQFDRLASAKEAAR
jgi:hypothetical protein